MRQRVEKEEIICDACHAQWSLISKNWQLVTINGDDYEMCWQCADAIACLQHFMILALDMQVSFKELELGS